MSDLWPQARHSLASFFFTDKSKTRGNWQRLCDLLFGFPPQALLKTLWRLAMLVYYISDLLVFYAQTSITHIRTTTKHLLSAPRCWTNRSILVYVQPPQA